ncbi:glycerol-3-phosphate responsive antiterminator [Cytobacillus praedii]|uniref:glycerol-3-phosphate responsive antiterminator n=1 Tax=Cytobacillus praedii TaxID=1742358 RepID=UPI000710F2F0|nr:glycerol-3-phosphate responsive antiterminator [Cytobacillus praedii]
MTIESILSVNRIIAASQLKDIEIAEKSRCSAIILMNAKLSELMHLPKVQKPLFIHIDLLKGLKNDKDGIASLKSMVHPTGIVTTKGNLIEAAKKEGLLTIQRIFLIDTNSLKTAIQNIKDNRPDAIEVMPGIAPSIVKTLKQELNIPIILAGLISTKEVMLQAFDAGAEAVSLSNQLLWSETPKVGIKTI